VNTNTVTLAGEILALDKAAGRGQCRKRPCPLPENAGQHQNGPVPSGWGGTADGAVFRLGGQDRFGYWPPAVPCAVRRGAPTNVTVFVFTTTKRRSAAERMSGCKLKR